MAAEWLHAHGYDSTLGYLRAMAIRVLEETGLLPHLNPGVLTWEEIQRLKPVSPSMGMMLETTSTRLWSRARRPALRLAGQGARRPAAGAGGRRPVRRPVHHRRAARHRRGPTPSGSRRCSRSGPSAQRHGHVQEVIVQNFRAKPRTAMQAHDDLELQEYVAAVAVTRLLLGPKARRAGAAEPVRLHRARAAAARRRRRLGRGLAADARPRQPRAAVAEHRRAGRADRRGRVHAARAAHRAAAVRAGSPSRGSTRGCARTCAALAGPDGLAVEGRDPGRAAVAGARPSALDGVRARRPARRGRHRRPHRATGAATSTPSTATGRSCASARSPPATGTPPRWPSGDREVLRRAAARRAATRPGSPTPSTSRCSAPTAPTSTRLCGARRRRARATSSATTSPTS